MTTRAFDTAYADGGVPTWDIGHPQPAVVRLVESGAFGEPHANVLDAGCGTGEHALLLAAAGHRVVGVDLAAEAIRRARAKAADRGADPAPAFLVGDALALHALALPAPAPPAPAASTPEVPEPGGAMPVESQLGTPPSTPRSTSGSSTSSTMPTDRATRRASRAPSGPAAEPSSCAGASATRSGSGRDG